MKRARSSKIAATGQDKSAIKERGKRVKPSDIKAPLAKNTPHRNLRSNETEELLQVINDCENVSRINTEDIQSLQTEVKSLQQLMETKRAPDIIIVAASKSHKNKIRDSLADSNANFQEFEVRSGNKPKEKSVIEKSVAEKQTVTVSNVENKSEGCALKIRYHTTITEEKRPPVIKKFRPPISKHRLKTLSDADLISNASISTASAEILEEFYDALDEPEPCNQTCEGLFIVESVSLAVASEVIEDLPANLVSFHEVGKEEILPIPGESQKFIQEESKNFVQEESQKAIQKLLISTQKPIQLQPAAAKLPKYKPHLVNAWLARKQSDWCGKQINSLNLMLDRKGLISTYKCMVATCSFTTISTKIFLKHLKLHESAGGSEQEFIYHCPYCLFKGDSTSELLEHYELHIFDKFQCGYCFYRSVDKNTCWEHVTKFHSKSPAKVYECPLENIPVNGMKRMNLDYRRRQNLKPLKCSSEALKATKTWM